MSCSVYKILDGQTDKLIDDGVDTLAAKISKTVKEDKNIECRDSKIDRMVVILNMGIQYVILSFVILALVKHDKGELIVQVITWVSYISLFLVAIQYRNVIATAGKLFAHGLDLETQIIILFSLFIVIITGFVKRGTAGVKLTLAIAFLIVTRLAIQMKSFLTDKDSKIPAFLSFSKELLSPTRISKIFRAF